MRLIPLILIVIFFLSSNNTTASLNDNEFFAQDVAAIMQYKSINRNNDTNNTPTPLGCNLPNCDCENGKIKSGDGLFSRECDCPPSCQCKSLSNSPDIIAVRPIFRRYQLFYVGAKWCSPCQAVKKELDRKDNKSLVGAGFSIDNYPNNRSHIVVCDLDNDCPEWVNKENKIPQFYLYDNLTGVIVKQFIGVMNGPQIANFYNNGVNNAN